MYVARNATTHKKRDEDRNMKRRTIHARSKTIGKRKMKRRGRGSMIYFMTERIRSATPNAYPIIVVV